MNEIRSATSEITFWKKEELDNTAKRCGIMAVLHTTYYDVWPWLMILKSATKVAKKCKNEKRKNNLTQSSPRTEKPRLWGSHIYTKGHCTPETPLAEKYYHSRKVHLTLSKCLQNFNFLVVTVFEIRYEISHIYTRGRCAPETPLAKKLPFPKSALDPI